MQGELYRKIIEESSYAFAYIKIITDEEQTPIDFEFIETNAAFESLFSLKKIDITKKRITEIDAQILHTEFNWISTFGRIGLTGRRQDFIQRIAQTDKWVSIRAMSPEYGYVVIQADDVTLEQKRLLLQDRALNFTPSLLCVFNFEGKFLLVNDEWSRVFGYQQVTLLDSNIIDYLHDKDRQLTKKAFILLRREGAVNNFVNRFRHLDGSYRSIEWRAQVSNGLIYGAAKDVTEKLLNEKQKQRELEIMNLLFEQALTGKYMLMLDHPIDWKHTSNREAMLEYVMQHQRFVRTNRAFLKMYNITEKEIIGMTLAEFFKHNLHRTKILWQNLLDTGRVLVESEVRRLDGSTLWILGDYSTLYDSRGQIAGHFGMQLDISDRRESEIALAQSERRYRLITEFASDVIWVYDIAQKRFNYISPSVFNFIGYRPEELISLPYTGVIHPEDSEKVEKVLGTMIRGFRKNSKTKRDWKFQARHIRRDQSVAWADSSINFRYGETGNIEIIGVSRDVTERKLYEEKILHLSYRDQLTGLYNRRYFEEQQAIRFTTKDVLPLSLVVCDVNGLKLTNDVFGHQVGDLLLKACADCLRVVKENDNVLARIGGDEFVGIFPSTSHEEVQRKIDIIQNEIGKYSIEKTKLSVSFGFATMDTPSNSLETLFKEAEDVMYRHKLLESSNYKHDVIKLLVDRLYEKGEFEKNHSEHVSKLVYAMGEALELPTEELEELRLAGLLHDIGKIEMEFDVHNRKEPLTKHELAQMRRHPEMGFQILRSVQNFGRIADWVLAHHERPDGNGYPQGLKGSSIPMQAQIIAVANAFDFMISASGYDTQTALNELLLSAGTQFDNTVVETFLKLPLNRIVENRR